MKYEKSYKVKCKCGIRNIPGGVQDKARDFDVGTCLMCGKKNEIISQNVKYIDKTKSGTTFISKEVKKKYNGSTV